VEVIAGERPARREFYGIAEIADALGLARQLVTVWRRRRSHGMPEPDAELASGPIWSGHTIEPWIAQVRDRTPANGPLPATPDLALRATRRTLRLVSLLLEPRVRAGALARALYSLGELVPAVRDCRDDELGGQLRELLAPLSAEAGEFDVHSAEDLARLRAHAPAMLAAAGRVTELVGG
jgi:transposase-like protein